MLSAFYDGVVVFGSVSFVLVVYNLILVLWWKYRDRRSQQRSSSQSSDGTSVSVSFENSNPNSVCTFKYRKDVETQQDQASGDNECAVCLSAFEDGEEVRQLPRCKHSFHAACIDMWLYSHSDCPLCRATVEKPFPRQRLLRPDENSQERSLDPGSLV